MDLYDLIATIKEIQASGLLLDFKKPEEEMPEKGRHLLLLVRYHQGHTTESKVIMTGTVPYGKEYFHTYWDMPGQMKDKKILLWSYLPSIEQIIK